MPSAPSPPAENFATLLRWLCQAVAARGVGGWLSAPLIVPLLGRLREINQRFARLAARLAAGRHVPRRIAPRRTPIARQPRRKNPLPQKFGWLLPLVPEAVGYRSQLEFLLRDPGMAALMAAAPAPMARVLRPLCWMLRVTPPPILADRRRGATPPPALAPAAAGPRPGNPPPSPPPRTQPGPVPPAPAVPARACGPPCPA